MTWILRHEFTSGWCWYRASDKIKIYHSDLKPFNITFRYFPHIDSGLIEEIVAIRKEADRKIKEARMSRLRYAIEFDQIKMPKINKPFPNEPICSRL